MSDKKRKLGQVMWKRNCQKRILKILCIYSENSYTSLICMGSTRLRETEGFLSDMRSKNKTYIKIKDFLLFFYHTPIWMTQKAPLWWRLNNYIKLKLPACRFVLVHDKVDWPIWYYASYNTDMYLPDFSDPRNAFSHSIWQQIL